MAIADIAQESVQRAEPKGLRIERRFTRDGVHPYDEIEWELRDSAIPGESGNVFEQKGVEVPRFWSQTATNVVASKYFRGKLGSPVREWSVKQMVDRVVDTIARAGFEGGYFASAPDRDAFADELKYLMVHQYGSFNSPVWFNIGVEGVPQQASACQPYRARVSTPFGLIQIGEIVETERVGLPVYDSTGLTAVVATKRNGRKHVYRVQLENGTFVEATADHLVSVVPTYRSRSAAWVRVDQLRPGMRLRLNTRAAAVLTGEHRSVVDAARAIVRGTALVAAGSQDQQSHDDFVVRVPEGDVDVSEAALAGWAQGDGFVGQYEVGTNQSLTVEFEVANAEERAWVLHHLDVAFPNVHRHEGLHPTLPEYRKIRLYGEILRKFVEKYELLARRENLHVPAPIWTSGPAAVSAYLKSVFQTDGYVSVGEDKVVDDIRGTTKTGQKGEAAVATISKRWMEDVQQLLLSMAIYSRISRKLEKREDRQDIWVVSIGYLNDRQRFAEEIGFVAMEKQSKLLESLTFAGKRSADERAEAVREVSDLGEEDVYDIQTLSGEYLSNNVVVHNCFILSVEDDMHSILDWFRNEGVIFKGGSGSGVNVSKIRSQKENLSGGGFASGPVSFMRGADSVAGSIKSGGTTRRAAKMVILDTDHPDIREFIWCKAREEKKAWALGEAGYDMSLNGEAWHSIQFQNANNSVRATDEFMKRVESDGDWDLTARVGGAVLETVKARTLLREISEAAWQCGDPGMQFDTTINDWHTSPASGRINGSNPCSEYVHIDDSACNLASLNLLRFVHSDGEFDVARFRAAVEVVFTAQEILVGYSDYPTAKIAENARSHRQLGLGYANLGALLMQRGLPYDSDQGRAYAAAITALMTGAAYAQSGRIAEAVGPYTAYPKNKDAHDRVIQMHRLHAYRIRDELLPASLLSAARQAWDDAVAFGRRAGYRNAQSSVLAPTGCLVGESLVATSRGLVRLRSLGDPEGSQWQPLDLQVATDAGPRQATQFYVNAVEQVVSIETGRGYRLQGTPTHRVKVVVASGEWVWKRFSAITAGDRVPLMLNGMVGEPREVPLPPLGELYWTAEPRTRVPRTVTAELAEFVGYFMGDGSLHAKGLRMSVTEGDVDVIERLLTLGSSLFGLEGRIEDSEGMVNVYFNSVPLTIWWEACGFAKFAPSASHKGKGWIPHVPDAVLYTNDRRVYAAFLRGLFEADGATWGGYASVSTTSDSLARDVQTILLALGFVTTRKTDEAGGNWGSHERYVIRLLNVATARRFIDDIGFISERKRSALLVSDHQQGARFDHIPFGRELIDRVAPLNDRMRKVALLEVSRTQSVTRRLATELLDRSEDTDLEHLLGFFYDTVGKVEILEDQATFDLSVPENLTYVANGFVSHNTISFMMDCDTTGVEPDIALVKYKKLVGGGMLKLVNGSVPEALRRLGYSETESGAITTYIEQYGTIEGAPGIKDEDLAVFDCAFKPQNGARTIHHMGHIKMMGSVQPFISGAISKTVNLPETATVADVSEAYVEAWKHGLKAIAIYRDGSKKVQPVSTSNKESNTKTVETIVERIVEVTRPQRRRLADTRASLTHKFSIEGHEGYITVGLFEDNTPGELFVTMAKEGSTLSGMMDAFATSVSLLFQYGVPLSHLVEKFGHMRFEPAGWTGNPEIGFAKSIVDYVFRWLGNRFLSEPERAAAGLIRTTEVADATPQLELLNRVVQLATPEASAPNGKGHATATAAEAPTYRRLNSTPDAPPCPRCGWLTVRSGTCHKCENCGETTGCS